LSKEHKLKNNANPALRILVKIFDTDDLLNVAFPLYKDADMMILIEHLKIMIEEDDE